MKNLKDQWDGTIYPDMIRDLPEIDMPFKGIRGWLMQGGDQQAVFFDIQPGVIVPPHTHCTQWGFVLDGELVLTIDGKTNVYHKGDWYFIPEGVVHSANSSTRVNVIDVFDAPDRYKTK